MRTLSLLSVLLALVSPSVTFADGFNSSPLSNKELSQIRGGYLMAGGLLIDFSINTKTIIDDVTVRDLQIASTLQNQPALDNSNLQKVIQVGQNNSAIPQELLDRLPTIATIIQNSEDNKVIQNLNTLNINVQNAAVFNSGNLSGVINNSTINSLR